MAGVDFAQRRNVDPAPRLGIGAASVEGAARRRIDRAGDRHCRQQRLSVRVERVREQGLLVGVLDDLAEIRLIT